jgi:hypothetical protein
MSRFVCALFGAAVLLSRAIVASQSLPPDTPEANPGRPTVSTPATLTPIGYLQFETAAFMQTNRPSSLLGSVSLRFSHAAFGFLLSFIETGPGANRRKPGPVAFGNSDVSACTPRQHWVPDRAPAWLPRHAIRRSRQ